MFFNKKRKNSKYLKYDDGNIKELIKSDKNPLTIKLNKKNQTEIENSYDNNNEQEQTNLFLKLSFGLLLIGLLGFFIYFGTGYLKQINKQINKLDNPNKIEDILNKNPNENIVNKNTEEKNKVKNNLKTISKLDSIIEDNYNFLNNQIQKNAKNKITRKDLNKNLLDIDFIITKNLNALKDLQHKSKAFGMENIYNTEIKRLMNFKELLNISKNLDLKQLVQLYNDTIEKEIIFKEDNIKNIVKLLDSYEIEFNITDNIISY